LAKAATSYTNVHRGVREPFVKINYADADADQINALVGAYAREHDVQNSPLEGR
jgi:hypothetical protein